MPKRFQFEQYTDGAIGLALAITALAAYLRTLAPAVLDGDAALFQYAPFALAITYPTGYPVYLLLAKVWITLLPLGTIAWRMNLFSAVGAALAIPLFYGAAHRLLNSRLAAFGAAILYATLPTYWRWATEAKIYALNILLYALVLWLLTQTDTPAGKPSFRFRHRFKLAALVLGLQIGVHSTTVLLIPGLLALAWINGLKVQGSKSSIVNLLFFILPLTLYLYIPLRAEWLIARYGREWAVAHGLLADFYHSGPAGWLRYFTAADFTGGVVTNWAAVPQQLLTVYLKSLMQLDFGWWGIAWGLAGLAAVLLQPDLRRRLWPLVLLYAVPIPFVLTYGQGEQNAFLLPSNLIFCLFAGALVAIIAAQLQKVRLPQLPFTIHYSLITILSGFLLVLTLIIPYQHAVYNLNWLGNKWNTATRDYWTRVLEHPLPQEAGLLATWGDLTSFWYMQHAEGNRPDLAGLYPPTETVAANWLAQDRPLFVAGPVLDDWPAGVTERYQVIPWGRLVRLAPRAADPAGLLPALDSSRQATFEDRLRLLGMQYPAQIESGQTVTVYLTWQALAQLPAQTRYSLRLAQNGVIVAQKDDALRPGWFPLPEIPAGQLMVGAYDLPLPPGLLPGTYQIQLAVYSSKGKEWPTDTAEPVFTLGQTALVFAPAATPPGEYRFGGELSLDELDFSAARVTQGKAFMARFLWRALRPPADNYTLLVELVDPDGKVWRDWRMPVETSAWQANQQVRQPVGLNIPASAPTGAGALLVRVSWLKADGAALPVSRWVLPAGQSFTTPPLEIQEKPDRLFSRPDSAGAVVEFNFDNKLALVGYQLPDRLAAGEEKLPLTLYWQGRGELRDSYAVFVHVVDGQGNIAAQHDGVPARGKQPVTGWAAGEYITDPVEITLPADLAPGAYTVRLGLYLPPDGPRLPLITGGDSVTLGTVTVE